MKKGEVRQQTDHDRLMRFAKLVFAMRRAQKRAALYELYDKPEAKVNEHKGNPSEALIALMTGVQDILGISLVSYDGYVKLFGEHRPCAYACSLWRVLSDYSHDYPTIFAMYGEIMNDYIALYGEPSF